ncbi:MAG: recombinase RecT [Mesoflavibacter sp.]|nr:recombinase RecT [Mesoflavibacter sp.]
MNPQITNWNSTKDWQNASAETGLATSLGGDQAKAKKFLIELQSVALKNEKYLNQSTPASLILACRDAALLDLSLDGREAAVVPFKGHAKLLIMTAGLIKLAFRNPDVLRIQGFVVRENDVFNYCPGTNKLTHEVNYLMSDSDRGNIVAAYAVAEIARGSRTASVYAICSRDYVMKCKSVSSSSEKEASPWNTWEEQMWQKTAVRKLFQMIPLEGVNIPDEVSFEESHQQEEVVVQSNEVPPATTTTQVPNQSQLEFNNQQQQPKPKAPTSAVPNAFDKVPF